MNQTEFLRFEGELDKRLPSVSAWLQRIETDVMADTMRTWFAVLEKTELVDAIAVLADLQADRITWPMPWDRLPGVIAQHAKTHQRNRGILHRSTEPGQRPFLCELCDNSGFVYVWMLDTVMAVENGESISSDAFCRQTATRCRCRAGEVKTQSIPLFDPAVYVSAVSNPTEDVAKWKRSKAAGHH